MTAAVTDRKIVHNGVTVPPVFCGLTVMQPWATLLAIGAKRIETRKWSTRRYLVVPRFDVAIHAGLNYPLSNRALIEREPFFSALRPNGSFVDPDAVRGQIVAVARLVTCLPTLELARGLDNRLGVYDRYHVKHVERIREQYVNERELAFGDYTGGRYGLVMDELRPLREPVGCTGALGFWKVSPELRARIEEQI